MPTVLVVVDDAATAGMIQEVLEMEGYRVARAVGGESLGIARDEQPAVILLDSNMTLPPTLSSAPLCSLPFPCDRWSVYGKQIGEHGEPLTIVVRGYRRGRGARGVGAAVAPSRRARRRTG